MPLYCGKAPPVISRMLHSTIQRMACHTSAQYNTLRAIGIMHHVPNNVPCTPRRMRHVEHHATCIAEHAACKSKHVDNLRHTARNTQHATSNGPPCHRQHGSMMMQPAYSTQHITTSCNTSTIVHSWSMCAVVGLAGRLPARPSCHGGCTSSPKAPFPLSPTPLGLAH